MFDVSSIYLRHNFAQVWALASDKLTSLEIGYISSLMVTELLCPNFESHQSSNRIQPSILPNIHKLCLSIDYITDAMINQHGKLKHLSLVRSQEYVITYFRRVNDLGLPLLADKCKNMESIFLSGFCCVTDTGFKTILHSFSKLYKLRVSHGTQLTDLIFHDISATSPSLTHVCLRRCTLLTNHAVTSLASNEDLEVLDLRDCRNLGDESLRAISTLPKVRTSLLDGSDISDVGLSYLRPVVISTLISLSVRGCKKLTDKCISALFDGSSKLELQELDLSNLPYLSDNAVLLLAKSRIPPLLELRMRQCPLIGDTSVMALASMQIDEERWHGNCLRLLDLFNCGGIYPAFVSVVEETIFSKAEMVGSYGPFLHVSCHGEELGVEQGDTADDVYMQDFDEMDELEQWLAEDDYVDEDMVNAEAVE
ncbi:hypothetical protein EV1_003548 [Malus domestica]